MTSNLRWAEDHLRRAGYDLEDAESALRKGRTALAIVRSASSIEYSVKAALYLVGVDPPEEHRLWVYLRDRRGLFPKEFREWVEVWAQANEEVAPLVVRARYGSRVKDQLPDELFSDPRQAAASTRTARRVREQVAELVRKLSRPTDL